MKVLSDSYNGQNSSNWVSRFLYVNSCTAIVQIVTKTIVKLVVECNIYRGVHGKKQLNYKYIIENLYIRKTKCRALQT